ncbi:MAG: phosphatidate cytidylyltransferase [Hyphomonadaceae bacterium]|nr:MAG: phosphatidate cytidylyltransferase [Hyphomonadaceae bacterium]
MEDTGYFEAALVGAPNPLSIGIAAVFIALIIGTLAAFILPRLQKGKWTDLGPRMYSWWVIVGIIVAALYLGKMPFIILFGLISFLALKEYLSLAPTRKEDRPIILLAYSAIIVAYWAIAIDEYPFFLTLVPVYLFLGLALAMAWIGRTEGYLATVGIIYWGVVVCVTNVGYVALLMQVPPMELPLQSPTGLVFFLLVITEVNDVAQYVWGKSFGKNKITPNVSPNKTWEGAIGGFVTTFLIIWFLGPVFTPLKGLPLALLGVLLPIAGFGGDITMSAIKRDLGVKDTSNALPGHGGILDRIDSLTFTAPIYFHFLAYFALDKF